MKSSTWTTVAYRGSTLLFAALMLLSAGLYLTGAAAIREALTRLGYPAYMLVILGTAKLLGSVALVQTRSRTLREWAYAGFTIVLIGATSSHLFAGDPLRVAAVPAALLVPLAVSYLLRSERGTYPAYGVVGRKPATV
jgi:hypothetical protein